MCVSIKLESNINKYFGELTLLGSIQRVIMTMAQVLSDYADFDVVIDKLIKEKGVYDRPFPSDYRVFV